MAQSSQNTSSFDRFNEALRSLDDQVQELRDRFDDRRRQVEDELKKRRDQIESQLKKNPLYKRVDQVRKDIEEQVERGRDQVFEVFGIATRADVEKIDRKLAVLSRKLNELAKDQSQSPTQNSAV